MDLVKGAMSNDLMGKVSSLLGESPEKTTAAMGAAVPSVLAGLIDKASTPDGARALDQAVGQTDDGVLGNLGNLLTGGGASNFLSGGGNMLGSLLGGNMMGGLTSVLGKFTGLSGGKIGMLMGVVAPLLMGLLKKQKSSMGLDASGLASMLMGQKQNVANAMPAGLGSLLGGIGGLGSIAGLASSALGGASNAAQGAARQVSHAAHQTTQAARQGGGGLMKLLLPLIILGVLGYLGYNMLGKKNQPTTPTNPTPAVTTPTLPAMPDVAKTLTDGLSGMFGDTTKMFEGITDVKSAEAALPKITEMNGKLDTWMPMFKNLAAGDAKTGVVKLVSGFVEKSKPMIDKVLAIPGVKDKIGPAVTSMLDKLTKGFAG